MYSVLLCTKRFDRMRDSYLSDGLHPAVGTLLDASASGSLLDDSLHPVDSMAAGTLADARADDDAAGAYLADLLTAAKADAQMGDPTAEQSTQTRKFMPPPPPLSWQRTYTTLACLLQSLRCIHRRRPEVRRV